MVFPDGTVLRNPSNADIAVAAGSPVSPGNNEFDVVVIGAGPAGLSAAVYGASEGFSTLVVDRGGIGGQATSSSLIRNYLGFPSGVSGRRLARYAYDQAWIFGANFTFMQSVTSLRRDGSDLVVDLSDSGEVRAAAVLLAALRPPALPLSSVASAALLFLAGAALALSGRRAPPTPTTPEGMGAAHTGIKGSSEIAD